MNSDTSGHTINVILVQHYHSDKQSLQQRLHILTDAYYAAIKRGEIFSDVKKIYLAIKKTKAAIQLEAEKINGIERKLADNEQSFITCNYVHLRSSIIEPAECIL
ncbi:hypothetical protein [Parafilimonas sp.]|uniref:hypothetical protein n=1 Tax=Parafilimonas sp. TaxID=1969739 RepID=UPI003F7EC34A